MTSPILARNRTNATGVRGRPAARLGLRALDRGAIVFKGYLWFVLTVTGGAIGVLIGQAIADAAL